MKQVVVNCSEQTFPECVLQMTIHQAEILYDMVQKNSEYFYKTHNDLLEALKLMLGK